MMPECTIMQARMEKRQIREYEEKRENEKAVEIMKKEGEQEERERK
jgi:hypothetical protein